MRYRLFAILTLLLLCSISPAIAQDGAVHEDAIEKQRKLIFGPNGKVRDLPDYGSPAPVTKTRPKNPGNPFDSWRPPLKAHGVTVKADAAFSKRSLDFWKDSKSFEYGTLTDLQETFLSFPAPPIPTPIITTSQVWQNNPPPITDPFYDPLIQFLSNGPGPSGVGTVGNLVGLASLQRITPSLLALAPLLRQFQSGTIGLNQLLTSSQGLALLSLAQSILQPLGMWNTGTLIAWGNYMTPSAMQTQLIGILTTLESKLLAALNIPPGQFVLVTNTDQPPPVNPFEVVSEIAELWNEGDRLKIGERYPDLLHSLIRHLGFTKPQGVIYASREGSKTSLFPYRAGIITEVRDGDDRDIYVLNEEGFFINPRASGVGRYYQGNRDLTLVYFPFEVTDGKVEILDSRASHDYVLYKRAVGGDTKLLNRAATDSTSLVYADIPFLEDHLHLRVYGGITPYAMTGGVMARVDYGIGELFSGHIGGGIGYRDTLFDGDHDDFVGYAETENTIRTPYASVFSEDGQRGVRTWASLTVAAAGITTRPTGTIQSGNKARWTLQGEARFIPEIHAQLATPITLVSVGGGVTTALVPGGTVDLRNVAKSLGIHPIRYHVEATARIRLHELISNPPGPLYLELGFVTEFSNLLDATRIGARFETALFNIDWLTEIERYHDSPYTNVRIGGSIGISGVSFTYLHSIKDDDYRLQASIDVIAVMTREINIPNKGLLDSYD
jgi:hypothetical protein